MCYIMYYNTRARTLYTAFFNPILYDISLYFILYVLLYHIYALLYQLYKMRLQYVLTSSIILLYLEI